VHSYVALFRGINVAGKNILPMKELAAALENMGFCNVKTYIQSVNVIFKTRSKVGKKTAADIAGRILKEKGVTSRVFLLGQSELEQIVKNNPFETVNGRILHVYFLDSIPENPELTNLRSLKANSEQFQLNGKTLYLYTPDGFGRSKLASQVEKILKVPLTSRNWNTVSKLQVMIESL